MTQSVQSSVHTSLTCIKAVVAAKNDLNDDNVTASRVLKETPLFKMIYLIVAVSNNHVIGRNNGLPWRIPLDMRWFKMNTWGGTVIMGRKTFEACGPLPGRRNIVISRRPKPDVDVEWYNHLDVAMRNVKDGYIIGGADLYVTSLKYVDAMIVTRVEQDVEGDVYFEVPEGKLVWSQQREGYRFEIYTSGYR